MVTGPSWKSLAVVLLAFLLVTGAFTSRVPRAWLDTVDLLATRMRYRMRGPQAPDDRLKVVGITEQTIAQFADAGVYYPFPRDWHAAAIHRLADAGAGVVVLDILFSAADSWDQAEDEALRDAIVHARAQGCEVVLAAAIERSDFAAGAYSESLITPAPVIMEAQPALGLSNTSAKLSFKLREQVGLSLPLGSAGEEISYHSQAVEAFRCYCRRTGRDFSAELAAAVSPQHSDTGRQVFSINYCSRPEQFAGHLYDYTRLFPELWLTAPDDSTADETAASGSGAGIASREPTPAQMEELADIFSDAVVFIGSRSRADNDYFSTPFGQMFGVDTNAQAFDTLARGRRITVARDPAVIIILAVLALICWGLCCIRPIWKSVLAAVAGAIVLLIGDLLLFTTAGIELSLSTIELGWILPIGAGIIYGGIAEERARQRIRNIFGRYVNDTIIDQLITDPELAGLGGVERRVAVLFNDIRSYSTITEQMSPPQIVSFLNIYLTAATDIIRANHGFVDKFLGDGLMAFFGGPVPTSAPADDAIRTGLAIIRVLHEQVHPQVTALGAPPFEVGIGIHFGPAVMGNIGSEQRHDYTLIGDAVNVAARVENRTKATGWAVLVTREVKDAARGEYDFELIGCHQVKGREQPVEMYRVIDPQQPGRYRIKGSGEEQAGG